MIADASMQLIGWAATKAAEAVVDRVAGRTARKVRAHLAGRARQLLTRQASR